MTENKLQSIIQMLVDAGNEVVKIYNSDNFDVKLKSDDSPVTRADKASSAIINNKLNQLFPGVPVLDEETKIAPFEERMRWKSYFLVDPVDGTKEFIKQNGEFCINLALIQNNRPVEGWIYQPLSGAGWYCSRGDGIQKFNNKNQLREIAFSLDKSDSIRIVASRSFFKPREAELIQKIEKTFPVEITRKGSSLKQVSIIAGDADMYLKTGPCSEWDTAPGQLMVEEFGGGVFQLNNFEPVRYNKPNIKNPHFVMLGRRLNTPDFHNFLKKTVRN